MKITITFPDEIAEKVCRLPNRDIFVSKAVADALAHEPEAPSEARLSRWAQLVERIERNPLNLGDYREAFDQDRRDFREGFHFKHDEP
jgi:hypothetical protein